MDKAEVFIRTLNTNACNKALSALMQSFLWSLSDEGDDYWHEVYKKLERYAEVNISVSPSEIVKNNVDDDGIF